MCLNVPILLDRTEYRTLFWMSSYYNVMQINISLRYKLKLTLVSELLKYISIYLRRFDTLKSIWIDVSSFVIHTTMLKADLCHVQGKPGYGNLGHCCLQCNLVSHSASELSKKKETSLTFSYKEKMKTFNTWSKSRIDSGWSVWVTYLKNWKLAHLPNVKPDSDAFQHATCLWPPGWSSVSDVMFISLRFHAHQSCYVREALPKISKWL